MARLSLGAGAIACLALTALLNHATTCCCGDSLLFELVAESCGRDAHAHDRERADHQPGPLGGGHTCYKAGSQTFLDASDGQPTSPIRASASAWASSPQGPALAATDLPAGVRPSDDGQGRPPPRAAHLGRWLL